MNKNVTKMMLNFSAACADHVSQKSHTHWSTLSLSLSLSPRQFIDPIIFANFHQCVVEDERENLPIYSHTDE
jgi:hypothetical protein